MPNASNATESLLAKTKRLLRERGDDLSLTQIAKDTSLPVDWLRSFSCGRIGEPGVSRIEKLHNFLQEYHAAQRFYQRQPEKRAS